jgi:hypothetical protein
MSQPTDLTRWNRAGLARVQYVEGNAAVFLERLRAQLADAFPQWSAVAAPALPGDPAARKKALEDRYALDPDDVLWQLTRSFARATHVLSGTLDAYANEGWIGTATQWESLRLLVSMLDYAPHPPSSASAPLALLLADGRAGTVAAGLQVRNAPTDGSAPLVFETLDKLDADAACNQLVAFGHDRNPLPLSGTAFTLDRVYDDLKIGDPVVFEDAASQALSAHVLTGVRPGVDVDGGAVSIIDVTPPLSRKAGFTRGTLVVHAVPKETLALRGPAAGAAQVGRALELAAGSGDLVAGDIVAIGRIGTKPLYRRIKHVQPNRLLFREELGLVDLQHAVVARPTPLAILRRVGARSMGAGKATQALLVAGDVRWLLGQWLADVRFAGGAEVMPVYECIRAAYAPVTDGKTPEQGCTTITLAWNAAVDHVAPLNGAEPMLALSGNTQSLLAPPRSAGVVRPDGYLQFSTQPALAKSLIAAAPKKTTAGDLAVLQRGHQVAWTRLTAVAIDAAASQAQLTGEGGWRSRGGGPFLLGSSSVRSHFTLQARLADWQRNATRVVGNVVKLATLPPALRVGATVIADTGSAAVQTRVTQISPTTAPPFVVLADPVPAGATASNLFLWGNVVTAGQGQTRASRILGSGDSTLSLQTFALAVQDVSFVADATMPAGVRADLQVAVAGERWTQVARLNDAAPADSSYQVRQSEDGSLLVGFGDGTHGRRLPTGVNNVQVVLRQGNGIAGNLPAGRLARLVRPDPLVRAVAQPLAASGGGDREGTDSMRTNAAATLLALERAVTLEDFALLARAQASVAQASAFALPPGRGQRENVQVRVLPAGGSAFTPQLGQQIQQYLLAHAMPGVQVTVLPYTPLPIGLSAVVRVRYDAFDPATVVGAVRVALAAAFGVARRKLGQPLLADEVTAVIEAVTGVENSDCAIAIDAATRALAQSVSLDGAGAVVAVRPRPEQCAHLDVFQPRLDVRVQPYQL